jgi:hypothetical protein
MEHSRDMLAFDAGDAQHRAATQVDSTRIRFAPTRQPKRFHQTEHEQLDLRYAKCLVSVPVACFICSIWVLTFHESFRYVIINWTADAILVGSGVLRVWDCLTRLR